MKKVEGTIILHNENHEADNLSLGLALPQPSPVPPSLPPPEAIPDPLSVLRQPERPSLQQARPAAPPSLLWRRQPPSQSFPQIPGDRHHANAVQQPSSQSFPCLLHQHRANAPVHEQPSTQSFPHHQLGNAFQHPLVINNMGTTTSHAAAFAESGGSTASIVSPRTNKRKRRISTVPSHKPEKVPISYPWATDLRARILSLEGLRALDINTIRGTVRCRSCERSYEIEYDLEQKFEEVASYILRNHQAMKDRAPRHWMRPKLLSCKFCGQENCVKPMISASKKSINWLFLFLGQMIGCCTLEQLKYFCKHTGNHRTGAKDRVVFLTYVALCKQLHFVRFNIKAFEYIHGTPNDSAPN